MNTVHEFSCERNVVSMHVTSMIVTVYAICESLIVLLCCKHLTLRKLKTEKLKKNS